MDIKNNYNSKKNKGIIWGVLMENNLFSGLENNQYNRIFSLFENKINEIEKTIKPNDSIIELNKKTINEMVVCIQKEKRNNNKKQLNTTLYKQQLNNKNNMLYKAEEIQKKRQEDMKRHYNQKQEEFNNIFNNKKPSEIDFSDKNDVDNSDIDKKLSEIMKKREMDLDFKKDDIERANNWFNNSNKTDIPVTNVEFLEIGENLDKSNELQPILINKNNDNDKKNKRVTFDNNIELSRDSISNSINNSNGNNIKNHYNKEKKKSNLDNFFSNLKVDKEEIKDDIKDETIKLLKEQIESLREVIDTLKHTIQTNSSNTNNKNNNNIQMLDKTTNTDDDNIFISSRKQQKKIDNKLVSSILNM